MPHFEIFIDRPIKVEVDAANYEDAIKIVKMRYNIPDIANVTFSQAIEVTEENTAIEENSDAAE